MASRASLADRPVKRGWTSLSRTDIVEVDGADRLSRLPQYRRHTVSGCERSIDASARADTLPAEWFLEVESSARRLEEITEKARSCAAKDGGYLGLPAVFQGIRVEFGQC